ncbi:hypothetical protein NG701_07660 [Pseudarthrobacter sp. HLT3-5]|uniref:hypothetical protein n=1 Tax=Pseudarthrobacter cellobiosi TaxID=2953654 RepID=UPI00208EEE61|nr:hypothetical protein [Pseudarthrobacter sp. HLT3-5]MCO4274305.1 hypothetical protein [Pseudarthrobacter sp. HLT3-5]
MSKVLLSVTYNRRTPDPTTAQDRRAAHLEMHIPDEWGLPVATAVSFKEVVPGEVEPKNPKVVHYITGSSDTNRLVGQLKTYIDATYTDPQQRKAHKDIVEQVIWGWRSGMQERAESDISAFTGTTIESSIEV